MAFSRTLVDRIAEAILAHEGIAVIWRLHVDAARASRLGHREAAAAIVEIADAAEEVWLGAGGS
jgi:hypothetical protein